MSAKINHMAMVSPIYPMLAKFYEAYFGLKPSGKTSRPLNAVTVGDGYVGLNINPQRDGYVAALDHFGMTVREGTTVNDLTCAVASMIEGVWLNQCLTTRHPCDPSEPIATVLRRSGRLLWLGATKPRVAP